MNEMHPVPESSAQASSPAHAAQAALRALGMALWVSHPPHRGVPSYLSEAYQELTGGGADDLARFLERVDPADRVRVQEGLYLGLMRQEATSVGPYRFAHPAWGERWFVTSIAPAPELGEGAIAGVTEDVTRRVDSGPALRELGEQVRHFLEASGDVVFTLDRSEGALHFVSSSVEDLIGIPRGALPLDLMALARQVTLPEDRGAYRALFDAAEQEGSVVGELRLRHADGGLRDVSVRVRRVSAQRFVVAATDITEHARAARELAVLNHDLEARIAAHTAELARASRDKQTLMREVHHRVRNNLQVVGSLLFLRATRAHHPEARRALLDMQQRVLGLAVAHDHLPVDEHGEVDLAAYVERMLRGLLDAGGRQRLRVRRAGPVSVDVDLAVPLALAAHELVRNAIEHGPQAPVDVHLGPTRDGLGLQVADGGPGFDDEVDDGMGLHLVRTLARQLGGEVVVVREPRFTVCLDVPLPARA